MIRLRTVVPVEGTSHRFCCLLVSESSIRSHYQDINGYTNVVEHRIAGTYHVDI